jgi:hypothetical protein
MAIFIFFPWGLKFSHCDNKKELEKFGKISFFNFLIEKNCLKNRKNCKNLKITKLKKNKKNKKK